MLRNAVMLWCVRAGSGGTREADASPVVTSLRWMGVREALAVHRCVVFLVLDESKALGVRASHGVGLGRPLGRGARPFVSS
mgnify:CR=1 FL=1